MAAPKKPKKRKKTAFVPRSVFAAAVAGASVIPLCVTACGGESGPGGGTSSGTVAGGQLGVAAVGFDSGIGPSVAAVGFDSAIGPGVAALGFDSGIGFSVAAVGFDSGIGPSVAALGFDARLAVADAAFSDVTAKPDVEAGKPKDAGHGFPDVLLTVANLGFDATTGVKRDASDKG
jgi:hypothetical protein